MACGADAECDLELLMGRLLLVVGAALVAPAALVRGGGISSMSSAMRRELLHLANKTSPVSVSPVLVVGGINANQSIRSHTNVTKISDQLETI